MLLKIKFWCYSVVLYGDMVYNIKRIKIRLKFVWCLNEKICQDNNTDPCYCEPDYGLYDYVFIRGRVRYRPRYA